MMSFDKGMNRYFQAKYPKSEVSPCAECDEYKMSVDNPYYVPTGCMDCKPYRRFIERVERRVKTDR